MGESIPAGKFDTILCDGLPLFGSVRCIRCLFLLVTLAACQLSSRILKFVRQTQLVSRERPMSNGIVQGVFAFAMRH